MHAYKLEDNFQLDIARKTELWAHAERYWLPRLGRSLEPVEAEEVLSILKGLFLRKLRTDEGIGAAIQFSKALFNEAYREYKSGSKRAKPVKEAKCPHCGEVLAKLGRGVECENDLCSMFGVGINGEMLKERTQMISLDEALEAGGDEVLVAWGLSTAADEDVREDFEGERLDERLVQLLNHPSLTYRDKSVVRAYLAGASSAIEVAAAVGVSSRTVERTMQMLRELAGNVATSEKASIQREEAVAAEEIEVEETAELMQEYAAAEPTEAREEELVKITAERLVPSQREWELRLAALAKRREARSGGRRKGGALRRHGPGRPRLTGPARPRAEGEGRGARSRSSGLQRASGRSWFI